MKDASRGRGKMLNVRRNHGRACWLIRANLQKGRSSARGRCCPTVVFAIAPAAGRYIDSLLRNETWRGKPKAHLPQDQNAEQPLHGSIVLSFVLEAQRFSPRAIGA